MTRFVDLLRKLTEGGVDFVIVGGLAAVAHGSPRTTQDVDVVYSRDHGNLERIVTTLNPFHAYLRGAPPGLPFRLDLETLKAGLNFTLVTDLGWLDLLGEIAGGGSYEDLEPHSSEVNVLGVGCRVLDLETLIHTKRCAGRPRDFETIAELEALRDRIQR